MEGRQGPNAQPEQKQDPNDEEIIDLTQIVATGDDDEIIELTEILEQPDQPSAATGAPEAPMVPHADDTGNAVKDEIVELKDIASPESAAEETELDDLDSALEESFGDLSDLDEESSSDFLVIEAPEEITGEGEMPPAVTEASDEAIATEMDPTEAAAGNTALQHEEKDEEPIDLLDVAEPEPATEEEFELDDFDNALDDAFGDLTDSDTEADMDVVAIDTPQKALETGEAEDELAASEVDSDISSEDEEVIDLLDIAATPETDVAEEPAEGAVAQPAEAETAEEDEEIIDLLDIAATPEADVAQDPAEGAVAQPAETETAEEDEEIIDLLDITATPEADTAQAPAASTATQPVEEESTAEDEEIIDLLDITATESAMDMTAEDMETPAEAAETAGPDDDFMVLGMDETAAETTATPSADVEEQEAAMDVAETSAQAIVISAATDPEYAAEPSATSTPTAPSGSESISVTDAQLEVALEKVIEKIYGQKIEQLLIQAIERTVKQEIEKIKSALLEDG